MITVRDRMKEHDARVIAWSRMACLIGVLAAVCGLASAEGHAGLSDGWIFWTQSPHGGTGERGTIGRADVDGLAANERFITGARAPGGIAVAGQYVYWANYTTGAIGRARLDGSEVNEGFIDTGDVYSVIGIAVDDHHIFWADSSYDPNKSTIGRASLDGSHIVKDFIKAGDEPVGIAVDAHHIYWTHRYWRNGRDGVYFTYAIAQADLDGTHIDRRYVLASNALDGVAVNSRYIFWSNGGEHVIGRANLDGSHLWQRCIDAQTLPLETAPEGLTADEEHVYWTNYPADTIARANLDGSDIDSEFIRVGGVPGGVTTGPNTMAPMWSGACQSSTPPLLLGPANQFAGPYGEGWGEVAPAVISNGGAAASGTVSQIHWTSWGEKTATGQGLHPEYTPHGGYYPKPLVMELRASDVRRCTPGGRLVYTRFTVREQVQPGGPMGKWFAWAPNMCAGFR